MDKENLKKNREIIYNEDSINKLIEIFNKSLKNLRKNNKIYHGVEGRIRTLEAIRDKQLDKFVNGLFLKHKVFVAEKESYNLTANKVYFFKKSLDELLKTLQGENKLFIKGVNYILNRLLENKIEETIEKKIKKDKDEHQRI